MAGLTLGVIAIAVAIGLILVVLSIHNTINNGVYSLSINPTLFVLGIAIAVGGSLVATKLEGNS